VLVDYRNPNPATRGKLGFEGWLFAAILDPIHHTRTGSYSFTLAYRRNVYPMSGNLMYFEKINEDDYFCTGHVRFGKIREICTALHPLSPTRCTSCGCSRYGCSRYGFSYSECKLDAEP
jgi:hypothetical protein